MQDVTKNLFDVVLSVIQLLTILTAGGWTYFRFFREGNHRARIEFDVECTSLGSQQGKQVLLFTVSAENKGNVEHKFDRITLRLRGISEDQSLELRPDGRLNFPESLTTAELVPEDFGYFFVRPGIAQPFSFTTVVPVRTRFVLARAAFRYQGSEDLHTVEKTFELGAPA